MDVALGIHLIHEGAEYRGSCTANTKDTYNNLVWLDEREKPAWDEIVSAYENRDKSIWDK